MLPSKLIWEKKSLKYMVKFPLTSEALRVFYLLKVESYPHGTTQEGNKNVCNSSKISATFFQKCTTVLRFATLCQHEHAQCYHYFSHRCKEVHKKQNYFQYDKFLSKYFCNILLVQYNLFAFVICNKLIRPTN